MSKNRKAAQEFIVKYIDKITQGGPTVNIYKTMFAGMSDKDFDKYMADLESGEKFLVVVVPNFSKKRPSTENNLEIAKELGHEFFQNLYIEGKNGLPSYLTPVKYLVVDLPVRRASQSLTKKISVPDNMKVIDTLTGQPTGDSQGAKISYPELQVCAAMGLNKSMLELMKYRGGDVKGHAALRASLSNYGRAQLENLKQFSSGVESTKLVNTYLTSAMLKSNL